MTITIMNNAEIPGKFERKIKWLLYNLREKFNDILYAKVFFTKEGSGNPTYHLNLVLGMPGNNVIIKDNGAEIAKLISDVFNSAKRAIARKVNFKKP